MEIYKIIFPDGGFYIGKTARGYIKRFKEHRKNYKEYAKLNENNCLARCGHKCDVYCHWRKFGLENVKVSVIDTTTDSKILNELEMYHILSNKFYIEGLNICLNEKSLNIESYTTVNAWLHRVFNNTKNLNH